MSELDKFKRRLVRSVVHILKLDREPQETAWEQMRAKTGCDCKLLWERMRALTIKKMKRLVAADDRNENIAAVARLSRTDWLVFDLVLVHEKLDVIGRDQIGKTKGQMERPIMEELFELVDEYKIERLSGTPLLAAWSALTRHYNSQMVVTIDKRNGTCSAGRHSSPMLLQKRWYQLKEATRANFYKLWNSYRGNQKLWDVARAAAPTPLQAEIAKRYPQVITHEFPEWEELIQQKKVFLAEQFEMHNRIRNRQNVDDKPDLVVIEPVIDTIDLGEESDGEAASTSALSAEKVNMALVKQEPEDDCLEIKEEPVEDGLSNVQITEATHVPDDINEDSNSRCSLGFSEPNTENLTTQMSMDTSNIDDPSVSHSTKEKTPDIELPDDLIKQKAEEYLKRKSVILKPEIETQIEDEDKNDDIVDDIIKQKADDFVRKVDIKKLVSDVVDDLKVNVAEEARLPADMTFDDEGIEFVDDGIEINEDDDDSAEKKTQDDVQDPIVKTEKDETELNKNVNNDQNEENKNIEEDTEEEGEPRKFDLKLLMDPVVYTTKLDDMIVFKGKKIDFVQYKNIIESVIVESRPVSKRAIKLETQDDDDDTHSQSNVSQSSKTASDDLFTNDTICQFKLNQTNDKLSINESSKQISEEVNDDSRHVRHDNDVVANVINDAINKYRLQQTKDTVLNDDLLNENPDLIHKDACSRYSSNSDYESEEEIDDSLKVKETSYLLQKPRSRSYNPIILCKNPDFNTRLKRLTAGFFSSERNRKLLSACKPMTIDMHKAFEDKLVNGTMYLKSSQGTPKPVKEETDTAASSSVMPSAMPIQSLLSKEKSNINIEDLMASTQIDTVDLTSRSKTINLKNISEIRRINQNLLTAQVPPMQHETVEIVDDSAKLDDEEPRVIHIHEGQRSISGPVPVKPEESKMYDIAMNYPGGGRGRGRGGLRGTPRGASRGAPRGAPRGALRGASRGAPRGAGWGQFPRKLTYPPPPVSKPINAPWRMGPKPKPTNIDDFLITIDTLNRMINKLDGNEEFRDPPNKKNRRPNWAIEKHLRESSEKKVDLVDSNSSDTPTPVEVDDTGSRNAVDTCELVPDANVPDAAMNVSVKTAETVAETGEKSTKAVKKYKKKPRKKYCCWCREKFQKLNSNVRTSLHTCSTIRYDQRGNLILCQCCCRQILLEEMKRAKRTFDLINNKANTESVEAGVDIPMDGSIVLSDEEIRNSNSEDSNDVRIPGFDPVDESPPVPKVRVTENPSKQGESVRVVRGTPIKVATVTSQVGAPVNTQSPPLSMPTGDPSQQQPVLRINVSFTPAPPDAAPTAPTLIPSINTGTSLPQTPLLQHVEANARPMPATAAVRTLKKVTVPVPSLQPLIKTSHRQIVIDASGSCLDTRNATQATDDRVFFLNSKTLSKKPKESPIFLGKNKILLTTVKFPKELDTPISTPAVQPSKVVPTLTLPTGVQLVLMPDGQLGYSVDPSVQLDESQLAVLPKILAAVQEQINMPNQLTAPLAAQTSPVSDLTSITNNFVFGGVNTINSVSEETAAVQSISLTTESVYETTKSVSEVTESVPETAESLSKTKKSISRTTQLVAEATQSVTETTQPVTEKKQPLLEVVDNVKGTENQNKDASLYSNEIIKPIVIPNDSENENSSENNLNLNTTEELIANSTNNINSSKDSEIITIEETDDLTDANVSGTNTCLNTSNVETEGAPGIRNLLSDLMEMSGISSDDTKTQSATQIAMPVEGNSSKSLVATHEETTEETLEGLSVGHETSTGPYKGTVEISETERKQLLTELSPISSLAQLKYACDNDGLFYKLDLDTGVLAPINVCIKKNLKPKVKVIKHVSTPVIKSVIDLTDDLETEPAKNVSKDGTIKPIKLIKTYPAVTPSILKKQKENLHLAAAGGKAKANNAGSKFNMRIIRKRKQNFGKIEVKIDLVDSDAPMEEEYLVDSSDSENELPKFVIRRKEYQSDDSSDDEPLAKKFRRLKEKKNESAPATAENNDSPVKESRTNDPQDNSAKDNTPEVQEDIDCSMEAPVPIESPKPAELAAAKVADNLTPTDDMDIEEPQFMSFLADENGSPEEEDCILGV